MPEKQVPNQEATLRSFVGSRLRTARQFWGLTIKDLAELVSASPSFVSMLERGQREPGTTLLEALSEELRFAPSYFYAESRADRIAPQQCHFRKRKSASKRLQSRARGHAQLLADLLAYLERYLGLPKVNIPQVDPSADSESVAQACRAYWGIRPNAIIRRITRLAENSGAVVLDIVQSSELKIDAFSVDIRRPLILLNWEKQSSSREIFNAAHEIGHLVMHGGRVTGDDKTEAEANAFASAFLLPADSFRREFPRKLDWPAIFEIKQRRHVSAAAIVRRGYDLGLIGASDYRRAYKHIRYRGWHKGEPYEPPKETPEILPGALALLEKRHGKPTARVASDLGWHAGVFEKITGIAATDSRPKAEVTSIANWRGGLKKRTQEL